jgi:outer membrane protein insertion porin family
MRTQSLLVVLLALCTALPANAQVASPPLASSASTPFPVNPPERLKIEAISVEGLEGEYSGSFVQQISGLNVGQEVLVPGDPAFSEAIRALYRLGTFSDVKIVEERRVGDGLFLAIQVTEVPKLADYTFSGIKKRHRKDLQKEVPLIKRSPVRTGNV